MNLTLHVRDRLFGDGPLAFILVEDQPAVAGSTVVVLPVHRRGIMNLQVGFQQGAKMGLRRIEDDLDGLRMGAVLALRRMRHFAARTADVGGEHLEQSSWQVLRSPAAAACDNRPLGLLGYLLDLVEVAP